MLVPNNSQFFAMVSDYLFVHLKFFSGNVEFIIRSTMQDDEIPFYQRHGRDLTDEERQRLLSEGIELQERAHYTHREDELILKNWKKFAKTCKLPVDSASKYIAHGTSLNQFERTELKRFIKANNLIGRLCHGLPHRSGASVSSKTFMNALF